MQKAIESVERYGNSLMDGANQKLWLEVILPLSKGIHAFVTHDYTSAYEWMAPCMERCNEAGGSDAQS